MADPFEADRLIKNLLKSRRIATDDEVATILNQMVAAPFRRLLRPVLPMFVGKLLGSELVAPSASSLIEHLSRRVFLERQWSEATAPEEYLQHLRATVRHPFARCALYIRDEVRYATVLSPTEDIITPQLRGENWKPFLRVVYSSKRQAVVTGYQTRTSDLEEENPLWLM